MFSFLLPVIYLSFISLGLPDALLGSAWPVMHEEFSIPVSYAGIISMIISLGTIVSSLLSDRLTARLGAGKVTAISVGMTAAALLGFSISHSFIMLCIIAIPYGLGAGSVDAAINNYVALHYESKHMSWLHCMWGIGAAAGPYVMGWCLTGGLSWNWGYRIIGILQVVLTTVIVLSLPLWKARPDSSLKENAPAREGDVPAASGETAPRKPLSLGEIIRIPGAREVFICFFCYCALESTAGLWASTYLVDIAGINAETAATFASLFYVGITLGRAANGFLAMRFDDDTLIRLGQCIIGIGILLTLQPFVSVLRLAGLITIGLGCAPVYPCIIHSTPANFGASRSQAMIGVQMASAYLGTMLMPPVFGLIAQNITSALYPIYMLAILVLMVIMHELMLKKLQAK